MGKSNRPAMMTPLLNVEDIEVSKRFYEALSFEIVNTWEEGDAAWCSMRCNKLSLMLNQTKRARSGERRERKDYSGLVLYLYVEDAVQFLAKRQLPQAKVRHVGVQHYGLDEVWIRDPDGYHLVIASEAKAAGKSGQ